MLEQTAGAFLVTGETIASWIKRVDQAGDAALLRIAGPVNKFPESVGAIVLALDAAA